MARLLEEEVVDLIDPVKMLDGDVAVIVKWHDKHNIGRICQRFKDVLLLIGEPSGASYPNLLKSSSPKCRVRVLMAGSKIIL